MEAFSNILEVTSVESSNGNAAVHGHVDGPLFAELVNHIGVEAGVSEHTNLAGNVVPVVLIAHVLKSLLKTSAHLLHATRHVFQVLVPHSGKLGVGKNDVDDTGSVNGRVGVDGASDLLEAGHNNILLGFGVSHKGKAASAFTVNTEVLGKGLEQHKVVGIFSEKLKRVGVLFKITRGESLISGIEASHKLLGLNNVHNFLPLLFVKINTGRVVSTNVEKNDRLILHFLKISSHAFEVEALGLSVVVSIVVPLETAECGQVAMKGPCRVRKIHFSVFVGVPVAEESETNTEGTSTGEGLDTGNTVLTHGGGIAEGQFLGFLDVRVNTLDASVFVVHAVSEDFLFGHADAVEDEGLAIIITVSTHTKEHLFGVFVLLELIIETEDRVSGGVCQSGPVAERTNLLSKETSSEHNR